MDTRTETMDQALMKFGVGQSVPRKEDPKLLRGEGHYTDDFNLPGQAHAVMVRSRFGHGTISKIEIEEARRMPGVLAVYTAADLKAGGFGPMKSPFAAKNRDGTPWNAVPRSPLATDRVRFVGESI